MDEEAKMAQAKAAIAEMAKALKGLSMAERRELLEVAKPTCSNSVTEKKKKKSTFCWVFK